MRGISVSAQDAWLKDRPKPVPVPIVKSVPYKPTILAPEPVRPFTRALIWRLATGYVDAKPSRRHYRIIDHAARKYGVTFRQITSDSREVVLVKARAEVAYRIREELGWTLARIGHLLGDRDHSTILHNIRRHKNRVKT